MLRKRLALGTAQFGLPYGVANESGQISRDDAMSLLEYAWAAGLDTLDTAIAYGQSEECLGGLGVDKWRVISKLPAIPDGCQNISDWVQQSLMNSLKRLKIDKLHGLLLHYPQELLGPKGMVLFTALTELKNQGLVGQIGISIYDPCELDALWTRFHFDIVQAPFNIIDRRLDTSGWLARLHNSGTEVHTRSVFLQGLLLMDAAKRPEVFNRWQPLWERWHRWLHEQALTPLQACLGFVSVQPGISRVIVGVDSLEQLQQILDNLEAKPVMPPPDLMSQDIDLINPSRWSTL